MHDAGLDLVEDQHRAMRRGQLTDALQVAGERRDDADVELDRLDDDRRDLAPMTLEDRGQRLGVVVRRDDRLLDARARQAGRGGHGVRARPPGPISSRGGWIETSTSSWWPW